MFAERGYSGATTQEIAAAAGVNEVTLSRRYGTKAALIGAALTHCLSRSPFGQVAVSDDVRADLVAIVRAYEATNRVYGGAVVTLLTEIPRHPELRAAVSALMPNLRKAAQIIAVHQERGQISPGDPLQKLVLLIAPLMAAGLWARSGPTVNVTDLDPPSLVDAFLNGHVPA